MFLLDIAPDPTSAGAIGVVAVVAFFFIALASGIFAFIMLRKTIKMALRMAIVAAILLIAVFGSIALYLFMQPSRPERPISPKPSTRQNR